jgi:hypothetical protein
MKSLIIDEVSFFNAALAASVAGQPELLAVQQRIASRGIRIVPSEFIAIKKGAGSSTKLFEDADTFYKGVRSLNNKKPKSGQALLVSRYSVHAFQLPAGANLDDVYLSKVEFKPLNFYPELLCGTISTKTDKSIILDELSLYRVAQAKANSELNTFEGETILEVPRFILPEKELECELLYPTGIDTTKYLFRVQFSGLGTTIQSGM